METKEVKVCGHCGTVFAYEVSPPGHQGDWCCGNRDVGYIPASHLLRLFPESHANVAQLRRRLEDRVRKDPEALFRALSALDMI